MKYRGTILAVIIVIGVVLLIISQKDKTTYTRKAIVGLEVPEFSLISENGEKIASSQLTGKTVLVHFWASWCKECKEEMPGIQELYTKRKSDPSFALFSIIYREDPGSAKKWMSANNYSIPLFIDPDGKAARVFGVTGVPETYIIDRDGILRKKIIGPAHWGEI